MNNAVSHKTQLSYAEKPRTTCMQSYNQKAAILCRKKQVLFLKTNDPHTKKISIKISKI